MKAPKSFIKRLFTLLLITSMMVVPVCAANEDIMPCFNYTGVAALGLAFDDDNNAHCTLSVALYSNGSGVSGLMKFYDGNGGWLYTWAVSDYEEPISIENIYPCSSGQTYTVTFEGYVYGKSNLPADRLEMSCTETCR